MLTNCPAAAAHALRLLCADLARGIIAAAPFALHCEQRPMFTCDDIAATRTHDCNHDLLATPRFFGTLMSWLCPCGFVYLMHAQKGAESLVEAVRLLTDRSHGGTISSLVYDMACALSSSFWMRNPHMASTM